jgi:hypothetical protein
VGAVAAMGSRRNNALAFGPAAEADVEEAAESEAHKGCECCGENANHVRVEYTRSGGVGLSASNPRCPKARHLGHPIYVGLLGVETCRVEFVESHVPKAGHGAPDRKWNDRLLRFGYRDLCQPTLGAKNKDAPRMGHPEFMDQPSIRAG